MISPKIALPSGAEVVGVISLNSFAACLVCKAKVEPMATDGNIGCYTKCSMQQKIASCSSQLNAKLVIRQLSDPNCVWNQR